ncbi:hypothetical protein ACFT9I_28930 [Streptomyces sp. NPDC057137]|uniref:hypothetical protein n=1 Tax=Streptomyces sp. NPDC057137 TaxID=3346030 RepID=UPI00363E25DA
MAFSPRELISVFDHIRRAAAWTRRQFVPLPKNRHRRTATTGPTEARASTPVRLVAQPLWYPKHAEPIRAEEAALIRPYVMTTEERTRVWCGSPARTFLIRPYFELPEVS